VLRGLRFVRRTRRSLIANWRSPIMNGLAATSLMPHRFRLWILRACGMTIGKSRIYPNSWFGGPNITVGDNTGINRFCRFDNTAPITIGDGCGIAMSVTFVTSARTIAGSAERTGPLTGGPITVGDGAWIGTNVTVLAGSRIGAGCVIAAGSVVRGDCMPNCLYAGVPARLKRELGSE
jgi:maltose O-acetyltransferase